MRTYFYFFLMSCLIVSCSDDLTEKDKNGRISFSLNTKDQSDINGRKKDFDNVTKVMVSIETSEGTIVYDLKSLTLVKFGENFISEEFQLPIGNYRITKFLVTDDDNNILYATPIEGSPFAGLVDNPLPIDFTVNPDVMVNLDLEVVNINEQAPADFGYITFTLRPAPRSIITLTANTAGIEKPDKVRTWILNKQTNERQWIYLIQSASDPDTWSAEVVLNNGEYEFETLTQTKPTAPPFPGYQTAYVDPKYRTVAGNTTLSFSFQGRGPFRLHDFDYHTLLVSMDPCDLSYQIYLGSDLRISYIFIDHVFWNTDGKMLRITVDELWIGSESWLPDYVPEEFTLLPDVGKITRGMSIIPPSVSDECEVVVDQSNLIDAMIVVYGETNDGVAREEYAFDSYKFETSSSGMIKNEQLPISLKQRKELIQNSN